MVDRNCQLAKLKAGYLFPEIRKQINLFLDKNKGVSLLYLGIGDATQPLAPSVAKALTEASFSQGTLEGFMGYGRDAGIVELTEKVSEVFLEGLVPPEDIFITDGAKPALGRLQIVFGKKATMAVQDPSYPVYVDTGVSLGQTEEYNEQKESYNGIEYLRCTPENNFFPDLSNVKRTDLIYICSPNNPTGVAYTKQQLLEIVQFAKKNNSILIYDTAYSCFISDAAYPKTIYEIEGALDVAIEIGSFSKYAGFTGLRLGYVAIPKNLLFSDGTPIQKDFSRVHSTFFNGASSIVQKAGIAALKKTGREEIQQTIKLYMKNTQIIKNALLEKGLEVYGGESAPYVWVKMPFKTSWEAFQHLLEKHHIVTTPGSGFGPAGETFLRFSGFCHPKEAVAAALSLKSFTF